MRSALALVTCIALAVPAAAQLPYTVVAKTGDQVAGLPAGVQHRIFFAPDATANGLIGFTGYMQGPGVNGTNEHGNWVGLPGNLSLVVREGSQAPGAPMGALFEEVYSNYRINSAGQIAFHGNLSSLSFPNDQGFWSTSTGTLARVARTSTAIPGQPGLTYGQMFPSMIFNDSGQLGFATLVSGEPGSTFWVGNANAVTRVAQDGTQAPGMPAGANWDFFQVESLNNNGKVAFWGRVTGGGTSSSNNEGIWTGLPGSLTLAARKGGTAHGGPAGAIFSNVQAIAWLNNQDQILFRGSMTGGGTTLSNDSAVWAGAPGSLTIVAREGLTAPGMPAGAVFNDLSNSSIRVRIADNGFLAIRGFATGGGILSSNDEAVWVGTPGNLTLVAREGNFIPGSATVRFGGSSVFDTTGNMSLSGNGWLAFEATLTGDGVTTANDESLWVGGPDGLFLIAREGDVIDLDPGPGEDLRTILATTFSPDGMRGGFLAWKASFSGNAEAVFLTPVPEPSGLLLLTAAFMSGVVIIRRRPHVGKSI